MQLPAPLMTLLEAIRNAGGQPFVVGGAVRDGLLGRTVKDYDVEVFGLEAAPLKACLATVGGVNAVGEAFTVFKVSGLPDVGDVDVALPRRDSRTGRGHRGITAVGDPSLSIEDAARRRDFTINALLLEPWTGEVVDPYGGRADLDARLLRAVDPETFGEDPLRALRAIQMAARHGLTVEESTARLCASMPLEELPAERIWGELEKLLLKAPRPSVGLTLMHDWGLLPRIAPPLVPLEHTPQDPEWHPEGDVWIHTLLALDQAVPLLEGLDRPRQVTVMLGVLCHDLGKPSTTRWLEGRLRSHDHERAGLPPTTELLDRWNVHTMAGYDVRAQVLALVDNHLKPGQLYEVRDRVSDGAIRRLAAKCEPDLLYRVATADCTGRKGHFPPVAMEWFIDRVKELDVREKPLEPLLLGRDILALGLPPGRRVGEILKAVYELQLDGAVTTLEEARDAAAALITAPP